MKHLTTVGFTLGAATVMGFDPDHALILFLMNVIIVCAGALLRRPRVKT